MADSDSPWSSEEDESLDSHSEPSSEPEDSTEPSGFFSGSNDTRPVRNPCVCVFPPSNNGVPRKVKALHGQLIELADSLLCIDRPPRHHDRGPYVLQPGKDHIWQNAVKALNACQIPANGYLDESQDREIFTTKAMLWIVRRLDAISARFRRNFDYRQHLSSTEARHHVHFFTILGNMDRQPRWRDVVKYEQEHPIPMTLLEPYNVEVMQRFLVLLLSMPMGGPRAAVLDLRDFDVIGRGSLRGDQGTRSDIFDQPQDAGETYVLDRFPWVDCLRWWCNEPLLRPSIPERLQISTPPASLFDKTRSAVQCIDLYQSCWKYFTSTLLTLFSRVECITHLNMTFDPVLESCERLVEAHWTTPAQWGLEPLQPETWNRRVPLSQNLVYLPKLTDAPPAETLLGVRSLADTVKLFILNQVDAHHLQRYDPVPLQQWAAHFAIRTDSTDVVDSRHLATAASEGRERPYKGFAIVGERSKSCNRLAQALGLPEKLMGDLLSAVFCSMCYQISRQQDGMLVGYQYQVPQTRRRYNDTKFFLSGYACVRCKAGFGMPAR